MSEAVVRAKFTVCTVSEIEHEGGYKQTNVELRADYNNDVPEDKSFSLSTPSGTMSLVITNPRALIHLKPGKKFYLDFIPVE